MLHNCMCVWTVHRFLACCCSDELRLGCSVSNMLRAAVVITALQRTDARLAAPSTRALDT